MERRKRGKTGEFASAQAKNCFLDYLFPLAQECEMEMNLHDRSQMSAENKTRVKNREKVRSLFLEAEARAAKETCYEKENGLRDEINRRLSFVYPNQAGSSSKIQILRYRAEPHGADRAQEDIILKIPAFLQGSVEFSAAQRGTIMHKVMECLDFKEALRQVEAGGGTLMCQVRWSK